MPGGRDGVNISVASKAPQDPMENRISSKIAETRVTRSPCLIIVSASDGSCSCLLLQSPSQFTSPRPRPPLPGSLGLIRIDSILIHHPLYPPPPFSFYSQFFKNVRVNFPIRPKWSLSSNQLKAGFGNSKSCLDFSLGLEETWCMAWKVLKDCKG